MNNAYFITLFKSSGSHLLAVVASILLVATSAMADQTVVGTNNPLQDVANVQTAVDAGGSILLRGTFNFGDDGRVKITKDVRIRGEADSIGEPKTIITGGFWSFYSPLPTAGTSPSKRGPIIAIRNIRFSGAKGTPLHFAYVGGLDVRGCTITKVKHQELGVKWAEDDTLPFQAGIVIGNRLELRQKQVKRAVRGTVRVEDNRFYMENDRPDKTAGYGILADWTWGADITLKANIISRASRNGIEVLDNRLNDKGEGSISIDRNRITTEDTGIPYPHKYGPNGIVAGWYFDTSGGADFNRNNRISLTGNRIEGRGEASTGMLLYASDMVVTCNDIIMGGGVRSRGIVQTGSRGFFANNRVRGEARYAIYCYPFEANKAIANTFAWTDFNDFIGIKGQVLLGGSVNVIIGKVSALEDKGKGNRTVDTKACALPEIDPEGESWEPIEP